MNTKTSIHQTPRPICSRIYRIYKKETVHSPVESPGVSWVGDFNVGLELDILFGAEEVHIEFGLLLGFKMVDDES